MVLEDVEKALAREFPGLKPEMALDGRGILTLRGECESWQQLVEAGRLAAKRPGVKNVVNKMQVPGLTVPKKDYAPYKAQGEALGAVAEVDVLIVGAGISGCGIARELSKYDLNILVAEMSDDVATGATKANNGNVHPGHAAKPGTLKAKLNIEGNRMYTAWAEQLGFELNRCGAMGVVQEEDLVAALDFALELAEENGVDGVRIVDAEEAYRLEPGLKRNGINDVVAALWLPSMGLVEPYKVAVALAENAAENGVRFWFDCTVADILTQGGAVQGAVTSRGIVKAKTVINCAGVYADEISAMAGDECYTIHPRKGTIAILDKSVEPEFDTLCEIITMEVVEQQLSNSETKGGGMCYTPERNILMGPSAVEGPDKEDIATTAEELAYSIGRGDDHIRYGDIIRFFSGARPADYTEDFVIEMSEITDGFINVGAIQSPGLAAAPAIAQMVEEILKKTQTEKGAPLQKKENWNPVRKQEVEFRHLSRAEQDALIQKDPRYGRVICRCESITEGEILDALRTPVLPTSVDAIKRRTRAGMGRCQGGFCQPRVLEILARQLGRDPLDITLKGQGTNILLKENRAGKTREEAGA